MPYRGNWQYNTVYAVGDTVNHRFENFTALTAHTSAAASEPDSGASWATDWNRTSATDATFGLGAAQVFDANIAPTGAIAETVDRTSSILTNNAGTMTTGKLVLQAIALPAGAVVTNITVCSGSVGATTPTNWGFALYTGARVKMAQTADQTTTAFAASTLMTKALQTPQAIPTSGVYYVGQWMAAATCNNHTATQASSAVVNAAPPILYGATSDTGLTTTAPATAGAITPVNACIYIYVS